MSLMTETLYSRNVVQPEVNINAKLILVGEAPGEEEERTHRPFVGPAGNLLDQCLHLARIARSECIITNVLSYRPDNNNIKPFFNGSTFSEAGYEQVVRLKEELSSYEPSIIVAFGNTAMAALTGKTAITKWRGSPIPSTLVPGKTVIPALHPAHSIRPGGFLDRYSITADIKKAARWAIMPKGYVSPVPVLVPRPSFQEASQYLEFLLDTKPITAIDIETVLEILRISCIGFSHDPLYAMSIPLFGDHYSLTEETRLIRLINYVLRNKQIEKIAHNMTFDGHWTHWIYDIPWLGKLHDTMVGFGLLYPDLEKSLEFVASIWTDFQYWKDMNVIDNSLYNCWDTVATRQCYDSMIKELGEVNQLKVYEDVVVGVQAPCLYMQMRGIAADTEGIKEQHVVISAEINEKDTLLKQLAGYDLNYNSPKQLAQYFYGLKGFPAYTNYDKKSQTSHVTTDEKAMQRIARKGSKEAQLIVELRKLNKMKSTYLEAIISPDGRLRGNLNVGGAVTGRMSSSKFLDGSGANMQNQPPWYRYHLMADPGKVLIEFDEEQAEWVIVAYLSQDMNMITPLLEGLDIHKWTASMIYSVPINQVTKEQRYVGKTCNHGLNYAMGINRFALELGVSDSTAKAWYNQYHAQYPGIENTFHSSIRDQLKKDRTIYNLLGRRRQFLGPWTDELYKAAYDYIPQSTVSHIISLCLKKVYGYIDLITQTHDSTLTQVSYNSISNVALAITNVLRALDTPLTYGGRTFKLGTSVKIGFRWGDMMKTDISSNDNYEQIKYKLWSEIYPVLFKHPTLGM